MSNPKYEPKTTTEKLGWVIEECGELQASIGKTLRHGLDSCDPTDGARRNASGERERNVDWILREMADVEKAIALARSAIIRDAEESNPPRVDVGVHFVTRAEWGRVANERDQFAKERDQLLCDRDVLRSGMKQTLNGVLDAVGMLGEWTTPTQHAAVAHLRALLLGYEGVAK